MLHFVAVPFEKRSLSMDFFSFFFPQFIILVVDSTDRERLAISKEELYRMLAHEVTHSTLPSMTIYDDNAGRWPGFSSTSIV